MFSPPPPPRLDAFSDGWQRCCHFCHSRPGKWKSSGYHEADFQCDRQESSQHGEEEGTEFSPYLTCAVTLGSGCNLIHLRGFVLFFLLMHHCFSSRPFCPCTYPCSFMLAKQRSFSRNSDWMGSACSVPQSVSVLSLLVLHLLCSSCHSLHLESDISLTRPSFANKNHTDS